MRRIMLPSAEQAAKEMLLEQAPARGKKRDWDDLAPGQKQAS